MFLNMATPAGHSLAGYIIFLIAKRRLLLPAGWKGALLAVILSNVPDLDYIPGYITGSPNIFHHGISHSIGFASLPASNFQSQYFS